MVDVMESAGGIIYCVDNWEIKFFLIKRHSLAKKIERVAPKWKIEQWEQPQNTVSREISEEAWINQENIVVEEKVWDTFISLESEDKWVFKKNIQYFLVRYNWDFSDIKVDQVEWYLGYHKWATIQEVLWLIYYENLREIFRKAYNILKDRV